MTKIIAAYLVSLLTGLAATINKIAVGTSASVDIRVEALAKTFEVEAQAEDVKASALREVAVTASLKSMAATQAANYRRGVAIAVREAALL